MNKENENCVQDKLNNFVLEQPWSSLSFTGKVRKGLLKTQQGFKKVFCNKVFSLKTIWFVMFIFIMFFMAVLATSFYLYTDYVYEEVTMQSERKLSDKKQVMNYVEYLKTFWQPFQQMIKHKKNISKIIV